MVLLSENQIEKLFEYLDMYVNVYLNYGNVHKNEYLRNQLNFITELFNLRVPIKIRDDRDFNNSLLDLDSLSEKTIYLHEIEYFSIVELDTQYVITTRYLFSDKPYDRKGYEIELVYDQKNNMYLSRINFDKIKNNELKKKLNDFIDADGGYVDNIKSFKLAEELVEHSNKLDTYLENQGYSEYSISYERMIADFERKDRHLDTALYVGYIYL